MMICLNPKVLKANFSMLFYQALGFGRGFDPLILKKIYCNQLFYKSRLTKFSKKVVA